MSIEDKDERNSIQGIYEFDWTYQIQKEDVEEETKSNPDNDLRGSERLTLIDQDEYCEIESCDF